ncbi:sperm acrosome membrane-associated protein 4-like [Gopherus flavomarginatus]|uniref:sperm acrosome membrane-associated protein 4-like n=1 Tax=Gopherus flavomarginatus TaxID=286002 RepID=UPI0021CBFD77|nr:sperm acrosome membrane-associated protein 4-like [Gopherus flavomarginatus]
MLPLLALSLLLALPGASPKECFFCEVTSSRHCPSTRMSCAQDEDCFVGHGAALGVSLIQTKGCTRAIRCGKEHPVTHMGVTYSLVTVCCKGSLCNGAGARLRGPSLGLQLALGMAVLLQAL